MSTSSAVQHFLELQGIKFSLVDCPWDSHGRWQGGSVSISHAAVARPVILKDEQGMVMVVMPITGRLNLGTLNDQLQRQLQAVEKSEYPPVFASCTSFILPALGALTGLESVVDVALLEQDSVFVSSGNDEKLIRLSTEDFQRLNPGAHFGKGLLHKNDNAAVTQTAVSMPSKPDNSHKVTRINGTLPLADMYQRIKSTSHLPTMPSLAYKIIQLNANPYAHVEDLATLLEKDPSLAAQIVRYAQSPLFAYEGDVVSVRQAISRVLGYDMVMNIALGFAAGRSFSIPHDGPLGLYAFWRQAIYTAALSQALCDLMPSATRPKPGTAYLAGLLHNFGLLILGHLFPKEFDLLHEAVVREPQTPLVSLEQRVLGATHMEMGSWLMTEWNMPQEVIAVIQEHHNPGYDGPCANYVRLVCLSNILLKDYALGDAESSEIPDGLLQALGLDSAEATKVVEQTMTGAEGLDAMARQFVA